MDELWPQGQSYIAPTIVEYKNTISRGIWEKIRESCNYANFTI